MPEISEQEARLIGLLRAIREFDSPTLITVDDVGDALTSLESVTDIATYEKEKSQKEVKAFVLGFVTGLGASRLPQVIEDQYEQAMYELPPYSPPPEADERPPYTGGPTGGVVEGQGTDPNLVTQSGPRPDPDKEVE